MRRGTLEHPKTIRLARELGIRPSEALGLVQGLLDWAYYHALRGDVGKWGDHEIGHGARCECTDGPTFVAALVAAGWLDRHEKHRLVIHDLHEHADDTWKKQLGRKRLPFANLDPGLFSPPPTPSGIPSDQEPNSPPDADQTKSGHWRHAPSGLSSRGTERNGTERNGAERSGASARARARDSGPSPCLSPGLGHSALPIPCSRDLVPTEGMLAQLREIGCVAPEREARLYAQVSADNGRVECDWTETGPAFAAWVLRHDQMGCAGGPRRGPLGPEQRLADTVEAARAFAEGRR